MELGEKLRQARIEAGLSQRQLCGEAITRNMLSQIENGSAKPSMKTLQYLAGRLGKNVSFFLEEEAVTSPNQGVMESARRLYDAGDWAGAALVLEGYQGPDAVFDREKQLLWVLVHLELAEQALQEGREPYAETLLDKAESKTVYCAEELERRRLLLLGRLPGHDVSDRLPSLDGELLLRAGEAMAAEETARAARLLDAVENQTDPSWCMLRGEVYITEKEYKNAARCFHGAEEAFPMEAVQKLELCYRELEDYKRAYEYACKQKK